MNVAPFINRAKAPGGTFYFPITDNISEVTDIMSSAMQQVFLGKAQAADALKAANAKVDALFK